MKNNNLNKVYNYINNYDLLFVIEKDSNGKQIKTFYTTGIKIFRKNLQDIAFKRFCSVPVVLNEFVKNAEILQDGNIFIDCGSVNYTLIPQKEKAEKTACKHDKFYIDTFINKNMIDNTKIIVKNNTVFLPVDYIKIGEITSLQEMKIQRLIDNILELKNRVKTVDFGGDDITKILIKKAGITGFELSEMLYDSYNIEDEKTNNISTMLLCGIGTTPKNLKKLEQSLLKL